MGHALMENHNGLIVGPLTTRATGHAERLAALALIEPCRSTAVGHSRSRQRLRHRRFRDGVARQGADPAPCAEPKWAPLGHRRPYHPPRLPHRLATHPQTIEEPSAGQDGGRLKMCHRMSKVDWRFALATTAYDLVRLPKSLAQPVA
jgi:hypothetical protein